jgi:hypothetical protein
LLLGSNTHALEVLFATKAVVSTPIGDELVANKELFISKQSFKPFYGFSISEWRKVKSTKMMVEKMKPSEQRVIDVIREAYEPDKVWMDEIVEILTKNHAKKEVFSTKHLGERRKADVDKYGYSVKNAYHSIRLLNQGIELLTSGTMTFPRPNADHLQDIRKGKFTLVELEKEYNQLMIDLENANKSSTLPEKPDRDKINKLLIKLTLKGINEN